MSTQTFTETLTIIRCANCGIPFGVPQWFNDQRHDDHQSFCCPSGHSQYFPQKSDTEKLQEKLARTERNLRWEEVAHKAARDQAETAEARRRAQKAVTTKLKKRIAAGVCPCCHRNFQDLRRHMGGQHPDYALPESHDA